MLASFSNKGFTSYRCLLLTSLAPDRHVGVLAEEGYHVGPFKSVIYHLDMLVNLDHF